METKSHEKYLALNLSRDRVSAVFIKEMCNDHKTIFLIPITLQPDAVECRPWIF